MKTVILAISLVTIGNLFGQIYSKPDRKNASSDESTQKQAAENRSVATRNITVCLKGELPVGEDISISTTGIGPKFQAQMLLTQSGSILSCGYTVSEAEAGYEISYTIGVQVRVETIGVDGKDRFEFRTISLEGKVLAVEGVPVEIFRNGDRGLNLLLMNPLKSD